jgi:hypothetical protein
VLCVACRVSCVVCRVSCVIADSDGSRTRMAG